MGFILINPLRCRVWSLHPRLDENLTEENCRMEIESFEKHGQLIPVLGRRLRGNPDYDVELIYGARRLFVARHLSMPLKVELREIADREGIVAMDAENRLRRDISAYERGLSYSRWLREGHFRSQCEIANALQISNAQVSRLLKLARLPPIIVDAFSTPADLCEGWGERLATLLADPHAERQMLQLAREVGAREQRPPADRIFGEFCEAAKASRSSRTVERPVLGVSGAELFRVRRQDGAVVFKVPLGRLSQDLLAKIERALARVVDPSLAQDDGASASLRTKHGNFVAHTTRVAERGLQAATNLEMDEHLSDSRMTVARRNRLSRLSQEGFE
jgi:ParB family transcriptional regulator, chromosome partitioning protein